MAYVRVGMDMSDWFSDNVGLGRGYVMSPCFFNVYMNSVVPEVNAKIS